MTTRRRYQGKTSPLSILCASLLLLLAPLAASAQDQATEGTKEGEAAPAEKEEKIVKGTIASTGNYGFGPQTIDSGSTGAAPGEEASVITAGVSRKSREQCQVVISNTSEENGYSVGLRVVERSQSGASRDSKYMSASLKPKESETREFRCREDSNITVELTSARKR